jgi:5-methylcytosine-specific restriction endonuclease McrA
MLAHAMSLLSHQVPSGNLGQVLRKLLEIAIPRLEKRKFGARSHRRNGHRQTSTDPRYVPADVKKAVWNRDGGQCTFLSEAGRRCPSRRMLEFDHAVEVARGGVSTVENVRLRCRAHNQYTAEQSFGAGFMLAKRKEAEHKREEKRSKVVGRSRAEGRETAEEENDVVPWLRQLGYRADQARHAAQHCDAPPDATLEDRVKAALRYLAPPHRRVAASS